MSEDNLKKDLVNSDELNDIKKVDFSKLTNKNADYMFHFKKSLFEKSSKKISKEKQIEIVMQMTLELEKEQKKGITANKLYGPINERVDYVLNGKKSDSKTNSKPLPKFWIMALDNALIMFMLFSIMYGLLGFFGDKQASNQNSGILTLILTAIIAGCGLAFFNKIMDPNKFQNMEHKWLKLLGSTLGLIVVWLGAFYLVGLIPTVINKTLPALVYIVLAAIAFLVRYYLKNKLGFQSTFGPRTYHNQK